MHGNTMKNWVREESIQDKTRTRTRLTAGVEDQDMVEEYVGPPQALIICNSSHQFSDPKTKCHNTGKHSKNKHTNKFNTSPNLEETLYALHSVLKESSFYNNVSAQMLAVL